MTSFEDVTSYLFRQMRFVLTNIIIIIITITIIIIIIIIIINF